MSHVSRKQISDRISNLRYKPYQEEIRKKVSHIKKKWTTEEDQKLTELVQKYGTD